MPGRLSAVLSLLLLPFLSQAQETPPFGPDASNEIIIRRKGEKDTRITLDIQGDQILINGKPLVEFNDDEITILRRRMRIRDWEEMPPDWEGISQEEKADSITFLGVSTEKNEKGARITEVSGSSPAGQAGLLVDDIITRLDGVTITGPESLSEAVRSRSAGSKVELTYLRKGKSKKQQVVLGSRIERIRKRVIIGGPRAFDMGPMGRPPHSEFFSQERREFRGQDPNQAGPRPHRERLGLRIQDTENQQGVRIIEVEDSSLAFQSGLKQGDTILMVEDVRITNTDEAREQLHAGRNRPQTRLRIRRQGVESELLLRRPDRLKTAEL